MSGIGIITNPYSKLNKRDPSRTKLLGYILGEQGRLELTRSLDELQQVAFKFRNSKISTLAINGGDGTIARTLTAFIRAYEGEPLPRVALLRGGTMNVLANNLRLWGSPEGLLYRYIEALSQEQGIQIKTLRTLEAEGNYGFLFADGVAVNVLREFYRNKGSAIEAGWLVAKLCLSAVFHGKLFKKLVQSKSIELKPHPGESIKHDSLTVMAATFERMPMGPRLFPHAKKNPDNFQFFTITCDRERLVWNLPHILMNNGLTKGPIKISDLCEMMQIDSLPPYDYSLDGEIFTSQENSFKLKLGPEIQFVIV